MRNIAEIIEDDRNGKQLSQTERQIAVAYIQGKYDAVRELKIGNNNTMDVLDKIREEINGLIKYYPYPVVSPYQTNNYAMLLEDEVLQIIDKYREGEL